MEHATGNRDNLLIAELSYWTGCSREDSSPKSQRPEVSLPKRVQSPLVSQDDIVLFSAFDLIDLVALEGHYDFVDGQHLLAPILEVVLVFRMEGSDHIFRFCVRGATYRSPPRR